jgi:uncharacterized protein
LGIHPSLRLWHNCVCESPMHAQEIDVPTLPERLDALDKYLRSERAPPECMWLSQLDGFLTGVAAGPERVPASEWLPRIWGGAEPTFTDADEEAAVRDMIMQLYNDIARSLERGGLLDPIYQVGPGHTPITSHWARGFLEGVQLRLNAWEPLLKSERGMDVFSPILAAAFDEDKQPSVELAPEQKEELESAAIVIPISVMAIAAYWRTDEGKRSRTSRGGTALPVYSGGKPYVAPAKTGRNEPCPCGSGKKFKKCCGNAQKEEWSSAA